MPRYVPTAIDDPIATELIDEYFTSRELGFTGGVYRRAQLDPAVFTPPAGVFLVMWEGDAAVGCGGVRMLDGERGEIKHLWIREGFRGRGWSRTLLAELEGRAAAFGATSVVLDTNASLVAAQALYRSSGYVEIPRYNENSNATHWFGKTLG